jgi:hypothetical protein
MIAGSSSITNYEIHLDHLRVRGYSLFENALKDLEMRELIFDQLEPLPADMG